MSAIDVDNLSFRYEGSRSWALRGVSLKVEKGELILLTGRSGSGKSTLLKSIVGLIPHIYRGEMKGEVSLLGMPVAKSSLNELVRHVGYVSQNPDNQIVSTVVERDVAFSLENLGFDPWEIRKRVERALNMLGIYELKRRITFELSDGQKARVALAGALAKMPEIIIMDEPTAFLDPCAARELLRTVRELNRELGITFLVVEHRVEIARQFTDREVCISDGKVKEDCGSCTDDLLQGFGCRAQGSRQAVELRNVSFTYPNGQIALQGISLAADEGELVLILGHNGSGKSTLLKMLNGTLKPSSGEVIITGVHENRRYEMARTVGLVPQNPDKQLFAESVMKELEQGPKNFGLENPQDLALAAAGFLGIDGLLARVPTTLSWGEKKRVSIASAVSWNPNVIAMDEPTAGQDCGNKMLLAKLVGQLVCSGKTVFVATHDMEFVRELLPLNPRAIVLNEGKIVFAGHADEILAGEGELMCRS